MDTTDIVDVSRQSSSRSSVREGEQTVQVARRTLLLSGHSSHAAADLDVSRLEYCATSGNLDAQITLVGLLTFEDKAIGQGAYHALQKVWGAAPNDAARQTIAEALNLQRSRLLPQALEVFDKLVESFPMWSGAYHMRAKCRNQMKDGTGTISDLQRALEICPVNYSIMVELGLALHAQQKHGDSLVLLQRARSLCPFLPMLDMFLRQVQESAQKAGASVTTTESAASASQLVEQLLPIAWVDTASSGCQEQSMLLHFGVELEARLAQVRRGHEDSEASLAQCQMLETLCSAWDNNQDLPCELRQYAAGISSLLQAYLATAQEVCLAVSGEIGSKSSHYATVPTVAIEYDSILKLADEFTNSGWAYVQKLGMDKNTLEQVHVDLHHVDHEMEPGRTSGGMSGGFTSFRKDQMLWLNENSKGELERRDVPGLSSLHLALQEFVARFVEQLKAGPGKLSLNGKCAPMLARYDPGGYYKPHIDTVNSDGRVLTVIYYLNRQWDKSNGGQLCLYPNSLQTDKVLPTPSAEIFPEEDSIVIFRADKVLHEVQPSRERRFALTQWHFGKSYS